MRWWIVSTAAVLTGAACSSFPNEASDAGPDAAAGDDVKSGQDASGEVTVTPEAGADAATHDAEAGTTEAEAAAPADVPVEIICGGDEEETNTHHACARYADGRVFCWGINASGQLGVDPSMTPLGYSTKPVQVSGLTNIVKLGAGTGHSCALDSAGTLHCWGYDGNGELGVPTADAGVQSPTPQTVTLPGPVEDFSLGDLYTCANLKDGSTYCWGSDFWGAYGDAKQGTSGPTPTKVPTGSLLTKIAAGPYAVCGIDGGGNVRCWGGGGQGILGTGAPLSNMTRYAPAATVAFGTAVAIVSNVVGFCAYASPALTTDGVYCWGGNSIGEIGNAAPYPGEADSPKLVPEFAASNGVVALAGKYYNTCALFSNGTVKCVGATQFGSVGSYYAMPATGSTTPTAVPGLSDATAISVGPSFACALRAHGGPGNAASAVCWGANQSGQLGNGTTTASDTPVAVLLPP